MANKIDDLRKHLFETLEGLRDKEHPMDLDRARTIADVGKVIVDSAKVEVDFMKVTGATQSTGFLPEAERVVPQRAIGAAPRGPALVAPPAGDVCVLCGVKLTAPLNIERGLCGSCSERPEAKTAMPARGARR